jgi:hypothetical protein
MSTERSQRPLAGRAITIAVLLLTTLGVSCSPGGAGSISVPSGKGKLKAASKIGWVKPKAGSTRPSQPTLRPH